MHREKKKTNYGEQCEKTLWDLHYNCQDNPWTELRPAVYTSACALFLSLSLSCTALLSPRLYFRGSVCSLCMWERVLLRPAEVLFRGAARGPSGMASRAGMSEILGRQESFSLDAPAPSRPTTTTTAAAAAAARGEGEEKLRATATLLAGSG